jgi:hypothetical protein
MLENKTMRKLTAMLLVIVLVAVPAFSQGTTRAFAPQLAPPAPLNRLSSASPDNAPTQGGQNDPAQMFQQILQQLTQQG